jgi:hypothetical protein
MRLHLSVDSNLHRLLYEELQLGSRGARQNRILNLAHSGLIIERIFAEKGGLAAIAQVLSSLPAIETPTAEVKVAKPVQVSQGELDDLAETFGAVAFNSAQ